MSDEIRDDWKEDRNMALAYGSLAGLVWGLVVSLRAFFAPLTMTWGQWCTLLVSGIAAALMLSLAVVALLRWNESWRAGRHSRAAAR